MENYFLQFGSEPGRQQEQIIEGEEECTRYLSWKKNIKGN